MFEDYGNADNFSQSQVAGGQSWNNWDDWKAYNLDATFIIPSGRTSIRPGSDLIRPEESTLAYDIGRI